MRGGKEPFRCAGVPFAYREGASRKAQGGREERKNHRDKQSIPCPAAEPPAGVTEPPAGVTEPAADDARPAEGDGGRSRQRERHLDADRQHDRSP